MTKVARSFVLLVVSTLVVGVACSDSSGPPPFEIVTPSGTRVSVLPGGSARFEVRIIDASFSAQYLVDGILAHEGPIFDFEPTGPTHTVTLRIESTQPGELPFTQEFTVVIEVPGNLLPQIVSSTFEPTTGGEALRDVFTFTITANDPDGTIASMTLDFGDGSPIATSSGSPLVAEHVYSEPGTYTLTATATDDVEIQVASEFTLFVQPPNQLPTGELAVNGRSSGDPVDGDAPLTVRLTPTGNDVDGSIVLWELDPDDGSGFQTIPAAQTVEIAYSFRETPYRPVLRLTDDDGDAAEIPSAVEIRVFRDIDINRSTATLSGNPLFAGSGINPAVFADGNDPLVIDVELRDGVGDPVRDAPVRLTPLRPELITPSGRNLGVPASVEGGMFDTNNSGRGSGSITTRTSTRVEAIPNVGFEPFAILVEANRGHGEWIEVATLSGANAETTVKGAAGRPFILPTGGASSFCPGDVVEIRVEAVNRTGGPASSKYTEIRSAKFDDPSPLDGAVPASGFTNWRTNSSGVISFDYTTSESDSGQAILAWVDGQPLNRLAAFNFGANCP